MNKKLQVFVSSTYTDLIEERQAAVQAILDAGHIPAGMELFKAGNESQLKTIYKWIDESDVYMLILGGRYGSVESNSGKSYTQLEYEYALSKNIPVFAVVLSQDFLTSKINSLGLEKTMESNNPDKHKSFKSLVMSKIIREVDDCKDIKITIHSTLNEFIHDYDLTGWSRNNNETEMIHLLKDNNNLIKENNSLYKKIEELQKQLTKKAQQQLGDYTYDELVHILKNQLYYLNNEKQITAFDFFIDNYKSFATIAPYDVPYYFDYRILRFLESYDLICETERSVNGVIIFKTTRTGNLFYSMLKSGNLNTK